MPDKIVPNSPAKMDDDPKVALLPPGRAEPRKSLFKAVAGHRFTKQIGQIIIYLGLTRLVTIAGNAWATRCLGPEKIGISGMIVSTVAQMSLFVVCTLDNLFIRQYKNAATEEERDQLVAFVVSQRFFFSLILGLAGMAVVWFLHPPREWWLGIFAALPYFVFSSILPSWVNLAQEDVPTNYQAVAISSVFSAVCFLLFFRHGQATGSDLVVQSLAVLLQFIILGRKTFKHLWPPPLHWSALHKFWPVFWEGRWLFASGLLFYAYVQLELPMLGYLNSLTELGKYRVASRLVDSVGQVMAMAPMLLFPRFVEWRKQGVKFLWHKQCLLAAVFLVVGLPVCGLAFLAAPLLFRLLYGAAFLSAAVPFAVLFASRVMLIINGVFSDGLWAQAQDKQMFWMLLPTAILSFTGNYLLMPRYGMYAACGVSLSSQVLLLVACFFVARRHTMRSLANGSQ